MENTAHSLSTIGFSNYALTVEGRIYKTVPASAEIKKDRLNRFYMLADNGKWKRPTLKDLYRKVYNKEFCIDNIISLPKEEWKEIDGTSGKYFISNYGRVKSLCGYDAIILKPF